MGREHAYYLTFSGVQLGDELFFMAPEIAGQPATQTPLFRGTTAGVNRATSAKTFTYRFSVTIIRDDPYAVLEQIEQWHTLIDSTTADVEIWQNPDAPALIRTIKDCYLQRIDPQTPQEPAAARIVPVTLEFVAASMPS